jgi:hypothetical protein
MQYLSINDEFGRSSVACALLEVGLTVIPTQTISLARLKLIGFSTDQRNVVKGHGLLLAC